MRRAECDKPAGLSFRGACETAIGGVVGGGAGTAAGVSATYPGSVKAVGSGVKLATRGSLTTRASERASISRRSSGFAAAASDVEEISWAPLDSSSSFARFT